MKKAIALLLILSGLLVAGIYFFIPATLRITQNQVVPVNSKGVKRVIENPDTWKAWWPGEPPSDPYNLTYKNTRFRVTGKRFSSVLLDVSVHGEVFQTELFYIPLSPDSILLDWKSSSASSNNPIHRWQHYSNGVELKRNMQTLLNTVQQYYSNEDHIYGIAIKQDFVQDSTLLSTSATVNGYPSVAAVDSLINKIKSYAAAQQATITGLPMLNVFTTDSIHYLTKVALPVNKKLPDAGEVHYKWMLGGGRILTAEVTGGPYSVNKAFEQMQFYIDDHHRTAPAISFQSLVTDRSKQPDSSKWMTRLYWPVM